MQNYSRALLDNGVRILSEKIEHVRSVSLGFWIQTGSRDENVQNNGISHFIEHMLFKGTEKRSAQEIAEAIEAVGGQLNAFTTKEYTCFYARVLDEHLDLALDVLQDMFLHSKFDAKDLETERRVILEEISMYEDAPDELIHDLMARTIWEGHALGRPILGNNTTIQSMVSQTLKDYYTQFYQPKKLVITAAGNIDHSYFVDKVAAIFADWKPPLAETSAVPRPQPIARTLSQVKDIEQVHICLGVPGLPRDADQIYTLSILNSVFGGSVSSRLFQEIREQRGLAYSVYSYHSAYQDCGLFSIYAGTGPQNLELVVELIMQELQLLQKEGIKPVELQRTKDQIKGSMYLSLESVSNRMLRLGKSELGYNRVISPEEIIRKVQSVQLEQVLNLAQNLFSDEKMAVATIGPAEEPFIFPKEKNGNKR